MRVESWLDAFDHELVVMGFDAADRAALVVEAEGYLREAGGDPVISFGSPSRYARSVAEAVGPVPAGPGRPMVGPPLAEVEAVEASYRRRTVLDRVDLVVPPGRVVALIGPNGAGKSTLLRILAGLRRPDRGTVRVRGPVGYVPQDGGLDPYLRPVEHIELFGAAHGLSRREARAEGARLGQMLGWDLDDAPVSSELSGGTSQKLSVILALLGRPALLLLDEPYQGMDADSSRRFWELLWSFAQSGQRSAVVSTHQSDVLDRAHTVVELTTNPGGRS